MGCQRVFQQCNKPFDKLLMSKTAPSLEIVVPPLDQEHGKADTFSGLGGQDHDFQIGRGFNAAREKLGRRLSSLYVCVCYHLS